MELEFDKEIDAILRKARAPVDADVVAPLPTHLDADAVAAFAENALPEKAKQLYTVHFADCGRCRTMLSQTILLTSEAVATAATHVVTASAVDAAVPWYVKIFRTPNLALAMGALVLTFSGILGYLALQNRSESGVTVSQVTDQERTKDGPYYSGASAANAAVANSIANAANISTAAAPAQPSAAANTISNPTGGDVGRSDLAPGTVAQPETAKTGATGSASSDPAKPVSMAPPPAPVDQPVASRDERKAGEDKLKLKDDADAKELTLSKTEMDRMREAPQAAKKSGPNRASGPRNNTQQEMNTQSVAGIVGPPTTTAGGKTFENRNGVWYDTAYHRQSTKTVKRGTDTYRKLDDGLRSIAESIGGTVVVVWTNKAYRIN